MSIKATIVCDGCGKELAGEPGGDSEKYALEALAHKLGWACAYEDLCPECVAYANAGGMNDERDVITDDPMEHGPYTITIPPEVKTPPPKNEPGMRHPEPVTPRVFGEALARKRKGLKE